MNWLNDLDQNDALYGLADECRQRLVESYYLIFSEPLDEE